MGDTPEMIRQARVLAQVNYFNFSIQFKIFIADQNKEQKIQQVA